MDRLQEIENGYNAYNGTASSQEHKHGYAISHFEELLQVAYNLQCELYREKLSVITQDKPYKLTLEDIILSRDD